MSAPAPDFPDPVKRRIVTGLATFQSIVEIQELLRDEYGIEAALPDIARHDPERDDCLLDETLRARFGELRELFVHGASDLPLASQPYRIRRLDRLSLRAEREGDPKLAAAIIDQAAKDLRAGPAAGAGVEGAG